jgi:glycosyltransferase involved in cell wall biosynthesis
VPDPATMRRVIRHLRRIRPDVIQTWMYHSDLIGALAARAAGNPPVAWGLHHSNLSPAFIKRSTLMTARACALVSRRLPAAIVCCAESTKRIHAEFGYDREKLMVIPNGFDLDAFRPDPAARAAIRAELGVPNDARLVGMLARFHPQKDPRNFTRAAGIMAARRDDVQFLLCGYDMTWDNAELVKWIDEAGIRGRIHLIGRRNDTPAIQASLDVGCLSSQGGEALPLTIGEAMSCGVPCAVTDVGDAGRLVGDAGRVAPPNDPAALAEVCLSLLSLSREDSARLGEAARRRIATDYSLPVIARRYADLHAALAERNMRRAPLTA